RRARGSDLAICRPALAIEDANVVSVHDRHIAVFEIGNAVRKRRQRKSVRAEVSLVLAIADSERASLAGADQELFLALENHGQRISAVQSLHGLDRSVL